MIRSPVGAVAARGSPNTPLLLKLESGHRIAGEIPRKNGILRHCQTDFDGIWRQGEHHRRLDFIRMVEAGAAGLLLQNSAAAASSPG